MASSSQVDGKQQHHSTLNAFALSPSFAESSSSNIYAYAAVQECVERSAPAAETVQSTRRQSKRRSTPQNVEFAGNASLPDYTSPLSPLILDAGSDWNTDTGATCHMTPHRHWFNSYKPQSTPIRLANNQIIHSAEIGSVCFQPVVNGKPGQLLEFHRVLHVPQLRNNLLSVLYLTQHKSYIVTIKKDRLLFRRNGSLLFTATVNSNNAAFLDGQVVPMSHFAGATSTCALDYALWHHRFAHLNHEDVRKLHSRELVQGMVLKSKTLPDPICEPCIAGKQHRSNVSRHALHHSDEPLQLVHSDGQHLSL